MKHEQTDDPRRERIATAALAALVSNPNIIQPVSGMVEIAVRYADALIAELDREEEG